MGTRADFYIGTGADAEWLGSIAFDGYRIDKMKEEHAGSNPDNAACFSIKNSDSVDNFRRAVGELLAINDDATTPADGWPWPWNDSRTTDYAYAFVDGSCKAFQWGKGADWPDMSSRKNVTLGKRSGVMLIST